MSKRLKDMTPDERKARLDSLRMRRRVRKKLVHNVEQALDDKEVFDYVLITLNKCLYGDLRDIWRELGVKGMTNAKLKEALTKHDVLWTAYYLLKRRSHAIHNLNRAKSLEGLTSAYELLQRGMPIGEHLLSLQSKALEDRDETIKRIEDDAKYKALRAEARAKAQSKAAKERWAALTPEEKKRRADKSKAIREEKKRIKEAEDFWNAQYNDWIPLQYRDYVRQYSNKDRPLSIEYIDGRFKVVSTPKRTAKPLDRQEITTWSQTLKDALNRHWRKCYKAIKEHDLAQP